MQIRKADNRDLSVLIEMQKRFYGEDFDAHHPDLTKAVSSGYAWVAVDQDRVIGYHLCELFGPEEAHFPNSIFLSDLFIEPGYRKRGIGSRLIQAALDESWPSEYGYFSLTHDPDEPRLTRFYGKFGFKECGKTDAGNVKMKRQR